MNAKELLKQKGIDPDEAVLRIDREEAIERLLEFVEEWELLIKVNDISRKDWIALLNNYSDAVVNYHPENDHQERGAFLKSEKMLRKYGLTSEDIQRLDFC